MKILIFILTFVLYLVADQKIDMHGGKSISYGGFSKNFDTNSTNLKNFR